MVQYRKSKKVGPFRLTVSQRGISTSVGAGPLRVSRGADGRVRRTVRVPGTGIYDTKVVGGTARPAAAAQPQAAQGLSVPAATVISGVLFVFFGLAAWASFAAGVAWLGVPAALFALAFGAGLAGGIFIGITTATKGKDVAHAPTGARKGGVHERADQPTPQRKRQPEQAVLEAEAEAAEAEAEAALARARAIRLRMEAQGNPKPAASPQHSEPPGRRRAPESPPKATVAKPRNSPARANGLRLGDRVQVVTPGDASYLKVGTVTRILDNGEVDVKLGMLSGTYTFGSDELEFLDRKIRW
jgi:hypothetical protein